MKIINIRKKIALSFLTLLFGGISLTGFSNEGGKTGPNGDVHAAEVKYVGSKGEMVFNVTYDNASGSRFIVTVTDTEGTQLFQSAFTDRKFNKKFKIADPESYSRLRFTIHNTGDNTVQCFDVKTSSRVVEDVVIKEVKE